MSEREWIFTFGFGHVGPSGESLSRKFVRIRGTSALAARQEMVRRWGLQWAFQYDSEDAAGVQKYGLTEWEAVPV